MRYFLLLASTVLCLVPASVQAQAYGDPGSLVSFWYSKYLGRPGDPGMATWVNALNQGAPPDQVLSGILASDEYYQRSGGTPQGFIARLYSDVLNQAPNPADLNFWVQRMYTEDRGTLVMQFLNQNPGVWVGPGPAASPPLLGGVPPIAPIGDWRRDLRRDWDHHHSIYEYRRPNIPYHYHADEHRPNDHHEVKR